MSGTPNYNWPHISSNQASKEVTANGTFDLIDAKAKALTDALATAGAVSPDSHPASPNAADDEFDTGASLDTAGTRFSGATAWAWGNQGAATALYTNGYLNLKAPASASTNVRRVEQGVSGSAWKYRCRFRFFGIDQNTARVGIYLRNSSSSKFYLFGFLYISGAKNIGYSRYDNDTTLNNTPNNSALYPNITGPQIPFMYLEVELSSGLAYFRYSFDGINFTTFGNEAVGAGNYLDGGLNKIGLASDTTSSNDTYGVFDWFRKVA